MIYKSNVDAVLGKLRSALGKDKMDSLFLEMAQNMYVSNLRRVHNEGKSVSEGSIGKYSQKSLYVNPGNAGVRRFELKGKTGKTSFKNGKKHKSAYFKSGYLGFKKKIGFSSKVNMQVTGRLKADWVLLRASNGYVIGFQSKYGKKVSEGNEDRFKKKIWGITAADRKINNAIVKKYIDTNA